MPTKQSDIDSTSFPEKFLNQELVDKMAAVTELVRNRIGHTPTLNEAIALVQVIEGVTPEEWERFASLHGLDKWLCIPLKKELSASVERLLSIHETLAFQRDHDSLTGLGNRCLFNRRFAAEVERALRTHTELSILYIDLDNFKNVNDTYGHACGDMVLQRLATVLKNSIRHYDVSARLGGEEFVLILPATSCWTGLMMGNRILEEFSNETFTCNGETFSMTFSGGVSGLHLLEEDKKNCEELLKNADKALYEAKKKGKNNITLAESVKMAKDQDSLVQAQEKQFLFSSMGLE